MTDLQEKELVFLRKRVKRLDKFLNQNPMAPGVIIQNEISFIFNSALLLFPDEFPAVFFSKYMDDLKKSAGFCPRCDAEITEEDKNGQLFAVSGICQSCSKESDDLETDYILEDIGECEFPEG